jgi:hypothetical protein
MMKFLFIIPAGVIVILSVGYNLIYGLTDITASTVLLGLARLSKLKRLERYSWNRLVSLDQNVNTAFGGDPDETISSRAAKRCAEGALWAKVLCKFLNWVDPGHCEKSLEADEGQDGIF